MNKIRLLLLLLIVAISTGLFLNNYPFASGLFLVLSILTALWLLSLAVKDASIIDIFWGLGFVVLAWWYRNQLGATDTRSLVLCCMVTLWGLRLSLHLAARNLGKPEDYRYQEMRKEAGKNFWWVSFLRVFMLQGFLLWIIAAPLLIAQTMPTALTMLDWIGIILFIIGFGFETVGDWQLQHFKKNPDNKGKVLNTGLWAYTRHPNYFGDALLWWGFFCFCASTGAWLYIFSPILMTFLLMKVSGVALLEKKLVESKPQYKAYLENTPAFFPKFFV